MKSRWIPIVVLIVCTLLSGLITPGAAVLATPGSTATTMHNEPAQIANTPELYVEGTPSVLPGETVTISIFLSTARGNAISDLSFRLRYQDEQISFIPDDDDGDGFADSVRLSNNVPDGFRFVFVGTGENRTTTDVGIRVQGDTFPDNFNDKIVEIDLKIELDATGTDPSRDLTVDVFVPGDIEFVLSGDTLPIQTIMEVDTSSPTILGNATTLRANILLSQGYYIEWYMYGDTSLPALRPDRDLEPPQPDSTTLDFFYTETGIYEPIAELYTPDGTFVFSDSAVVEVQSDLGGGSDSPTYVGNETTFTTPFTPSTVHRIFEGVQWDFGDDSNLIFVTTPDITHEYDQVGTYNVTGTLVVDPSQRDVYMAEEAPFQLTTSVLPPELTLENIAPVGLGETASVTANIDNLFVEGADLLVDFGDGTPVMTIEDIPMSETQQVPFTHTYEVSGTLTVSTTLRSERFGVDAIHPRAVTNAFVDVEDPGPVCPPCECPNVQGSVPAALRAGVQERSIAGDGESTTIITATVTDENNLPLQGQVVTFTTSLGEILLSNATTSASGEVATVLRSSVTNTELLTATITAETANSQSDQVEVAFTGIPKVYLPVIMGPGATPAPETEPVTATLSLDSMRHSPFVPGDAALFSMAEAGGESTISQDTCPPCECPDEVVYPSTVPITMTLQAAPASIDADGVSTTIIQATLVGSDDVPVYGQEVVFTSDLGSVMIDRATTNPAGVAATVLKSGDQEGIATVQATAGITLTNAVTITLVGPSTVYLPVIMLEPADEAADDDATSDTVTTTLEVAHERWHKSPGNTSR